MSKTSCPPGEAGVFVRFDPNKSLEEHPEEHPEADPVDPNDAKEVHGVSNAQDSPATAAKESPNSSNDKQE